MTEVLIQEFMPWLVSGVVTLLGLVGSWTLKKIGDKINLDKMNSEYVVLAREIQDFATESSKRIINWSKKASEDGEITSDEIMRVRRQVKEKFKGTPKRELRNAFENMTQEAFDSLLERVLNEKNDEEKRRRKPTNLDQ